MLRVESETGWWLITHPDHAHLASEFAAHWGNDLFAAPQPRANVLHGIRVHDDGWATRDAQPSITRQGKPSAFSVELVGQYSAFEEIDLAEYLAVRECALDRVEARDLYAALLVSMHTYNLLTERANRSTIVPQQLALLDEFLDRQRRREESLRARLNADRDDSGIIDNFRLLQATDNLSLYSCVGYTSHGTLLHPLRTTAGTSLPIDVIPVGPRCFRLKPYPFDEPLLELAVPARHVDGRVFSCSKDLAEKYAQAPVENLAITICEN